MKQDKQDQQDPEEPVNPADDKGEAFDSGISGHQGQGLQYAKHIWALAIWGCVNAQYISPRKGSVESAPILIGKSDCSRPGNRPSLPGYATIWADEFKLTPLTAAYPNHSFAGSKSLLVLGFLLLPKITFEDFDSLVDMVSHDLLKVS